MNILANELGRKFEEVEPMDFYREIFPEGELDDFAEERSDMTKGKYTAIAIEITNEKKKNKQRLVKRYSVTDDLDQIDELTYSDNFCVLAPISYAGKERHSRNARFMYALCVELDDLIVRKGKQEGLQRLISQWGDKVHWIPRPTFVVASGTGLHLYYLFERPIPLFPNVSKSLEKYKRALTELIWNRHVTSSHTTDKIQQESVFQAFRMVGTITKQGDRVHAFRTGERVTIDYMNHYVTLHEYKRDCGIVEIYKSDLTLAAAKEKYPEWYEKRILRKEPKGHWIVKRDLYDWWKRKIEAEAAVGHRYYCLMVLAIYAIKCDIDQDELEKDCFELMELLDARSDSDINRFTEKDVLDALQSFYDKGLITYPVTSISNRSGIAIEKNKRNYRKQKLHIQYMNMNRLFKVANGECTNGGRPFGSGTKESVIKQYRAAHPDASKADCIRETGLSKPTVYKWWN